MPARKPTALKLLEGTARPDRATPLEPKLAPKLLPCPDRLTGEERQVWTELTDVLFQMGVVTVADPVALEDLAHTIVELRELRVSVKRDGYTYESETEAGDRFIRPNPAVKAMADASRRQLALLGRFGMTPADRAKVSAAPKSDAGSPWDDLDG
jgi:P27 family predicted phage terminase small subunit